jgi:hypothetical protein
MCKDTNITDVIFRVDNTKDFKGTVYTLFPHEVIDYRGLVSSYQHVGQHSGANYLDCINTSKPATAKQYKALKLELENIGYRFNIVNRQNKTKYYNATRRY